MFKNLGKDLVKAFNTGVSYFLPAVVIGGVFLVLHTLIMEELRIWLRKSVMPELTIFTLTQLTCTIFKT